VCYHSPPSLSLHPAPCHSERSEESRCSRHHTTLNSDPSRGEILRRRAPQNDTGALRMTWRCATTPPPRSFHPAPCHSERSEESRCFRHHTTPKTQILRFAQDDMRGEILRRCAPQDDTGACHSEWSEESSVAFPPARPRPVILSPSAALRAGFMKLGRTRVMKDICSLIASIHSALADETATK